MTTLRQLETRTKLYAAFAIVLLFSAAVAGWLLLQLGELSHITAELSQKLSGPAGARATELVQSDFATVRNGALASLAAGVLLAVMLCLWLAAEIARPLQQAIAVARRVAAGDLGTRIDGAERERAGGLMHALQEMNDKLVAMIVKVRAGTETIASGSGQIAAGNLDLSARTEQQAASLEETASSMEELTATVKQNAEHAHQASKLAVSASQVAVKGGEVVAEVVGTMASINDSSKRIAEIIGVIDGIAFQTNILALNAAVEAARAGEQGRGFAVVASEVRNLAQRSAAAAKEIKALIDDSVEKVNAGTLLADKAGSTMNEVVTSVKRVTDIIGEIADASAEQTTGIEQVNQAIAAMDQATQQNAALVEESAAAAASLREQAGSLSRVVGAFALGAAPARAAPMQAAVGHPVKAAAAKTAAPVRARAGSERAAPARKAAPVQTAKRASTAATDVDWEEF